MKTRALLTMTIVALAACTSATKREAAALADAVDRFRIAEDAQKPGAAAMIRAAACTDAAVCDVKTACVSAGDKTARALELKSEVEARLADLESKKLAPDDPAARALPLKLDESERLLREGRAAMHDCETKLSALRLKLGV
jgi:hypothetical protein